MAGRLSGSGVDDPATVASDMGQELHAVKNDEVQGRITALEHVIATLIYEVRKRSGAGVVSNIVDRLPVMAERSDTMDKAAEFAKGYRNQLASMEILMCQFADDRQPRIHAIDR